MSTKIRGCGEQPYDIAGVTAYALKLRKQYTARPVTTMEQRKSPSKIMIRAIKDSGLL